MGEWDEADLFAIIAFAIEHATNRWRPRNTRAMAGTGSGFRLSRTRSSRPRVRGALGLNAERPLKHPHWDAAPERSTYTDARGGQWVDDYDNGLLVAEINPLGNATAYTYDAALQLSSIRDARGNTTYLT